MALTVTGIYPKIERLESGLYSLDSALRSVSGGLGLPLRTIYEIYGRPGVGKSSLSYYLAGKTAHTLNPKSRVDLCDLEVLDPDYVVSSMERAGFEGTLNYIGIKDEKNKRRTHEAMVQELVDNLCIDAVSCGVLDSVGAIVPVAEAEGEVGEANMGRRAKFVAQIARKSIRNLRDLEIAKALFIVNHVAAVIGGRGHTTPGGESVKFLGAVRLMVWQDEIITNSKDEMVAFVAQGQVEKLRYGAKGRKFKFVVIPGYGVSRELTALIDCVELGLATRKTTVKVGKDNIGYLSKLVESARSGYDKTFEPFFSALDKYKSDVMNQVTPEGKESYDESESVDVLETSEASLLDGEE